MAAHYAGMRGRCLNEAALRCVLVPSSINKGEATARRPAAQLEARLQHGSVLAFIACVTAQLLGELPGEVILCGCLTRSEDLTQAVADTGRQLSQADDYRNRLLALANRPDTQVEDPECRQHSLKGRMETEVVVRFRSDCARECVLLPVYVATERSGWTFGESAGAALHFSIVSLP